ncbi:MAG TPA: prolyl oligopeptidase family serine peptidase [Bryobacteraceae bacterium]|jgi:dipeptidyl aminopeptidase/acylaminoacyl peptidase
MNTLWSLILVPIVAGVNAFAQQERQALPPLIDRELLFGDPEISGANLSPSGEFIAFLKPWKNTRNIWVKKTGEPFSTARLLTTETKRPIPGFLWTRDSKYVVFVKDNEGDENFNVFAVDPAAANAAGAEAPVSRDLTGLKGVRVELYSAPKNDPGVLYIGLNDRDKAWHDLYKLDVNSGAKTLLRKNVERVSSWIFDLKGNLKLATRTADNGDQEVLRVDADALTEVYSCSIVDTCVPVHYHKDGKRVYMITNKESNLAELALFDPIAGKAETVESDPLKRVDIGGAEFSEATDELIATQYVDERQRTYFHNKAFEAEYKWLEHRFPGRNVDITGRTADDRLCLISVNGDTEPGEIYLYEPSAKKVTLQYRVREKLPRTSLASMRPVHYKSSDGLEIAGFLTLPKGVPEKGLPTLMLPHGGPWARDYWGYNAWAQFFANRGYAVLMINFRGSTGYGKQFLNAGNGEWGKKMQDDVTWGVKYLVSEGIADPKRIGIIGGSYGGYATLAGVTVTPDLYRAAVDYCGPSNLITLLDAIPPYWESGRKIMYARMADPGTPAGKEWLEERSPIHEANKIKTPLMVVQGANDPRVNKREADQIVVALRDRKFPVEYLLAPDEGHGFQRPVNNMAMLMAVEKFFAQYLDGRYQEGGSPEVVKRLAEITVDPATVTLAKKIDESANVGAPKPVSDLVAGTWKYGAKISLQGQEITMKMNTQIQEKDGAWVITDTTDMPMGQMTETATVEKNTFQLRRRVVQQGPVHIDVSVGVDNKVTGKMSMNGQDKQIDADAGGPLFADAAGAYQEIARLPLADGFSAIYRNFDVQKQKPQMMEMKVIGSETVEVASGKYDTFKVEITHADGSAGKTTVWIAKDSRAVVKLEAMLPQMGGATLTAELLP